MLIVATEFITPVNMLKLVTHRLNTTQTHKKGKKILLLDVSSHTLFKAKFQAYYSPFSGLSKVFPRFV